MVFHGRRLGIQLRELHNIPVVGGLQGYDPDGTTEEQGDEAEVLPSSTQHAIVVHVPCVAMSASLVSLCRSSSFLRLVRISGQVLVVL